MEIASKIKRARVEANLTQEEAAEKLGVSRQTLSNWETGKTYPDIVSVVKMSDLYAVSLDYLLKGEQPKSEYLTYLEKSTDMVKAKEKFSLALLLSTYFIVWAISIGIFWLFTSGSDAMGYSLVYMFIVMPVAIFTVALLIGKNDYFRKWKWISSIGFGGTYMLMEYATFSLANMLAFEKINPPQIDMIFIGGCIALLGMAVGVLISKRRSKKEA